MSPDEVAAEAAEYRRRLALCGLATCSAERVPYREHPDKLCREHLDAYQTWARERPGSAQLIDWLHTVGGGYWDPRPADGPPAHL